MKDLKDLMSLLYTEVLEATDVLTFLAELTGGRCRFNGGEGWIDGSSWRFNYRNDKVELLLTAVPIQQRHELEVQNFGLELPPLKFVLVSGVLKDVTDTYEMETVEVDPRVASVASLTLRLLLEQQNVSLEERLLTRLGLLMDALRHFGNGICYYQEDGLEHFSCADEDARGLLQAERGADKGIEHLLVTKGSSSIYSTELSPSVGDPEDALRWGNKVVQDLRRELYFG